MLVRGPDGSRDLLPGYGDCLALTHIVPVGCESSHHILGRYYYIAAITQCPTTVYSEIVHVHKLLKAPLECWAPVK